MITVWHSDNSNKKNNGDKPFPLSIVTHFPDAVQFPKYIYPKPFITSREREVEKVLLAMRGVEIIGYWYGKTRN